MKDFFAKYSLKLIDLFDNKYVISSLILGFSTLVLWPLFLRSGWPYNHEWLSWKYRTICYVNHFKQGDLFPLWSSPEAFGMGSPLPLYYHKLYYYFSAIVFLFFGNIKSTMIFCLVIVNFFGVLGMYKALKRIDIQTHIALIVSCSLLFQYYTITDWFIRGSFAEYMALMFIPWFFNWAFGVLLKKGNSSSIGVILGLTYLAHSIIAYYMIFAIVFTQFIDFYYNRRNFKLLFKSYFKAVPIFICIVGLFNFPILITSKYYDPSYIKFDVSYFFHDIIQYFRDTNYSWTNTWEGYTVQLNPVMWIFTLVFFAVSLWVFRKKDKGRRRIYAHVYLLFVFFSVLQFRFSIVFYNNVPGADYIQFPWRLLSFIQISLLFILALLFSDFSQNKIMKFGSQFYLVLIVSFYPLFKPTSDSWQWFTKEQVEEELNGGIFGVGEYMPVVKGFDKPELGYFQKLAAKGIETADSTDILEPNSQNKIPEQVELKYKVYLSRNDTVIFPINFSGLERSYTVNGEMTKKVKPFRIDSDPRIRIVLPKGTYDLFVYLPSLKNFFR